MALRRINKNLLKLLSPSKGMIIDYMRFYRDSTDNLKICSKIAVVLIKIQSNFKEERRMNHFL